MRVSFSDNDFRGALITFSGIDGSGKSTSLRFVRRHLRSLGVPCIGTNLLPDHCRQMRAFRAYADDPSVAFRGKVDLPALCLVFLGNRLLTMRNRLIPLMRKGTWVLCDRYVYTALAELKAVGCSRRDFEAVRSLAELFPKPHLSFLLEASPEEALRRVLKRPNERHKRLDPKFFQAVSEALRSLAEQNGVVRISSMGGKAMTFESLQSQVDSLAQTKTRN